MYVEAKSIGYLVEGEMKTFVSVSLALILVLCNLTLAFAQERPQVFALPDARAGETYLVRFETLLRERYRLRLDTASKGSILQWAFADGELPPGLTVRTDGTISGIAKPEQAQSYRFRVKVIDAALPDENLILECAVNVKASSLKLVNRRTYACAC